MYTMQQCTVAPFLTKYSEQTDISILTGAMDFDNDNIMTYLVVFGQELWFGNRMKISLINLNKC